MKFLLGLLTFLSCTAQASIVCNYDFDTKSIEINKKMGEYNTEYIENNNKVVVYVKDLSLPNETDDYLTKQTLDNKYKMTYSLSCGKSI